MDVCLYALLLEDVAGHTKNVFGGYSKILVFKGSLLQALVGHDQQMVPFTEPLHNYKTLTGLSDYATLYCHGNQIHLLTDVQKDLLCGIQDLRSRLGVTVVDELSWVESLKIGCSVYVTLHSKNLMKATVQYIGEVDGINGRIFGVKLQHKHKEGVSGTIGNVEYFKSKPGCAMFVAMDKLTKITEKGDKSYNTLKRQRSSPSGTVPNKECVKNLRRLSLQPDSTAQIPEFEVQVDKVCATLPVGIPSQDVELYSKPRAMPSYEIGNKVSFYDEHDRKVSGKLRWIDENTADIAGVQALMSIESNYSNSSEAVAEQEKLSSNSNKDKRIQKAKEEIGFDDWKTLDGSMLDSEVQEKLLNEAKLLKQKSIAASGSSLHDDLTSTANDDNGRHEAVQLGFDDDSTNTDVASEGPIEHPHRPIQHSSLHAPSSEDYSVVLNQQDLVDKTNKTLSVSTDDAVTQPQCFHAQPDNQLEQSQQPMQHDKCNATTNQPHQATIEMEREIKEMKEQLQRMDANVCNSFQKALDVQKTNKQLKEDNSHLHSQLSLAHNQLSDMKKSTDALTANMTDLRNQLCKTQEQLSVTQYQLSNVQKSNEELKASNSILQSQLVKSVRQLSLTQTLNQQQLLGIQSMVTCSRLWVISHDQFVIGEEIGRGAWATVHKAAFRGATVAAKCLHHLIISPKTKELFQHEMEMALQCHHQNIVTFLGATIDGAPVILMELMDCNLRNAYEQKRILDHQVLGILHNVAIALHFLHTRPDPVIHRDVSSANVLLKVLYNGEWLAKLGDLGTAKIQQQVATAGPGAIAYGAPEARNPKEHSPKMDVYSFGILVMETLTSIYPYEMVDTLRVLIQQQYPQYYRLVTSCTKQQSSDRPTMYDVLVQLNGIHKNNNSK